MPSRTRLLSVVLLLVGTACGRGCGWSCDEDARETEPSIVLQQLSGRVLQEGKPVEGASLWLDGRERGRTNAAGQFAFPAKLRARSLLEARAEAGVAELVLGAFREPLTVHLEPWAELAGRVVDDLERPVLGLVVQVERPDRVMRRVATNALGRFETRLPKGAYAIRLDGSDSCGAVTEQVELTAGEALELELMAMQFKKVRGILVDLNEHPLANAEVLLRSSRNECSARARTNADGRFLLPRAPIGAVSVRANVDGSDHGVSVQWTGEGMRVQLSGEERVPVTVQVLDERSRPLPGVHVKLIPEWLAAEVLTAETASTGSATLEARRPGSYRVVALWSREQKQGQSFDRTAVADVLVRSKSGGQVVVSFAGQRRDGTLSGQVVDSEGNPIPGAKVTAQSSEPPIPVQDGFLRENTFLREAEGVNADPEGRFSFEGLRESDYYLEADVDEPPLSGLVSMGSELMEVRPSRSDLRLVIRRRQALTTVTGRVVDAQGAAVKRFRIGERDFDVPDGRYTLEIGSPTQPRRWTVSSNGYVPVEIIARGVMGRTWEAPDAVMKRARSLRILVLDDEGGSPAADVDVRVFTGSLSGEGESFSVSREGPGRFTASSVPFDPLHVVASPRSGGVAARALAPSDNSEISLVLPRAGSLHGKVIDRRGVPVAGVSVSALCGGSGAGADTDSSGAYRIETAVGECRLTARPTKVGPFDSSVPRFLPVLVQVLPGVDVQADLRAERGTSSVRVLMPYAHHMASAQLLRGDQSLPERGDELYDHLRHTYVPADESLEELRQQLFRLDGSTSLYDFTQLPAGTYTVIGMHEGAESVRIFRQVITLQEAEQRVVRVRFTPEESVLLPR